MLIMNAGEEGMAAATRAGAEAVREEERRDTS